MSDNKDSIDMKILKPPRWTKCPKCGERIPYTIELHCRACYLKFLEKLLSGDCRIVWSVKRPTS